jgi:hypothetical protein
LDLKIFAPCTVHRLSSQMFQKLFDLSFGDDKKKKPVGFADFGMGQDEQARFCRNVAPVCSRGVPGIGCVTNDRPRLLQVGGPCYAGARARTVSGRRD